MAQNQFDFDAIPTFLFFWSIFYWRQLDIICLRLRLFPPLLLLCTSRRQWPLLGCACILGTRIPCSSTETAAAADGTSSVARAALNLRYGHKFVQQCSRGAPEFLLLRLCWEQCANLLGITAHIFTIKQMFFKITVNTVHLLLQNYTGFGA